jgi:hypothetical protein
MGPNEETFMARSLAGAIWPSRPTFLPLHSDTVRV